MIIISYIYKGNNTRCKVICHLEVGRSGAGCCVSAPDGEGTGIGPLRTAWKPGRNSYSVMKTRF